MSCDYQSILAAARCFECIPPGLQAGIQTSLLNEISGAGLTVDQLISGARCLSSCIPPGMLEEIKARLLCDVVDNLAPSVSGTDCNDQDVLNFFIAASINNTTQRAAVCELVRSLKTLPLVGTKYWNRESLIYPFVGGNLVSHSVNLKKPGTNDLTYPGAGLIHSAVGVQGNGTTGYADTRFLVPSLDTFRAMYYVDIDETTDNRFYFGCATTGVGRFVSGKAGGGATNTYSINDLSSTPGFPIPGTGAKFVQRISATIKQRADGVNSWTSSVFASTGIPDRYLSLFGQNFGGVSPIGATGLFSVARISSFSFGLPLDPSGVGNTEHLEYKTIWDTFNTALGRGHP